MTTSNTITKTDLANILNEVLPTTPTPLKITTVTLSGTTNGSGAISIASVVPLTADVLSVKTSSNPNYMCIPWVYNNATWYCKVVNWDTLDSVNNSSVNLTIKYISA